MHLTAKYMLATSPAATLLANVAIMESMESSTATLRSSIHKTNRPSALLLMLQLVRSFVYATTRTVRRCSAARMTLWAVASLSYAVRGKMRASCERAGNFLVQWRSETDGSIT
jgi:hypothetical protein